jgi:DNA-binding MarR family transcriptional regulator
MSPREADAAAATMRIDPVLRAASAWREASLPAPVHLAAAVSILRTSQIVGATFDRVLRERGITRNAYLLLITLRVREGYADTLSRLSRQLIVHPTTVSMAVDQLERLGYAERAPDATDGRTTIARVTEAGLRATDAASQALADAKYGLGETSASLAAAATEILRQVRHEGDSPD